MKQTTKLSLAALLATTLLMTTGCSSFFKRNPAQAAVKPKHYIMTLHGVRGNEKSFTDFPFVVQNHLEKIDPQYDVILLTMVYKTAQLDFTPQKAAIEVNHFLDENIKTLNPDDKISVVAYSMGGQVGLAWYYDTLSDAAHKKYVMQTYNFVSLGGAFWGAEEPALLTNDVNVLKNTIKGVIQEVNNISQAVAKEYLGPMSALSLKKIQNNINQNELFPIIDKMSTIEEMKAFYDHTLIKNYTKSELSRFLDANESLRNIRNSSLRDMIRISFAELQALSIAGQTVTELRTKVMSYPTVNHTQWTSISTLVPCFKTDEGFDKPGCEGFQFRSFENINAAFAKYSFGHKRRETDSWVITPSSVVQFFHTHDNQTNYPEGKLTRKEDFYPSIGHAQFKVIFAETFHASLIPDDIYDNTVAGLGKLGKSWTSLADDVVVVRKEKCLSTELDPTTGQTKCNHAVYKYILDELADCDSLKNSCDKAQYNQIVKNFHLPDEQEKAMQDKLKSEIHGFTLEMNLRLPKGYDFNKITEENIFDYIKMDFTQNDNQDRIVKSQEASPYQIHIGRKLELGSILIKKINYTDESHLKVNFTGLITTAHPDDYHFEELQKGKTLKFKIALNGLKSREIEAVVAPFHSTFLDLNLSR
jgi:hypothetical protein